jgi:lysozyme family protein
MLILRGIAGTFGGKAYPNGALDEESAKAYAELRGYEPRVLDVSGEAAVGSKQHKLALAEVVSDPDIEAIYGFSGGAYNLAHVLDDLTPDEKEQLNLVVALGAPGNPASRYKGPWETVYRTDPPSGHMDGPRVLLAELQKKQESKPTMTATPLRYLIAVDDQLQGVPGEMIEVGYDGPKPKIGGAVRYCNLFDQTGTGKYGPYLTATDTAAEYDELVVDPKGAGWKKLLADQCAAAEFADFDTIEFDNPDGYTAAAVLSAVQYAADQGLRVLAKNPLLCDWDAVPYVKHPAVTGVVVEEDEVDATPAAYDVLRKQAGKPQLPIYFVAFKDRKKDGTAWATATAKAAAKYSNMFVTMSADGEYTSSMDVLPTVPIAPAEKPKAPMAPIYTQRWPLYAQWWDDARILPNQQTDVTNTVIRLRKNESRYQNIEKLTGVPGELIACLHERESTGRFDRQLAQGDPLNRRSTNEPIAGPFDTFEASAIWALHHDKLDAVIDWRIEKLIYFAELWNGWGYALYHPGTPSPYIVGGTTVQKSGKYVADGVWSSSTWDKQIGVLAMLLEMIKQDPTIKFVRETVAGTPGDPLPPLAPPAPINKIPAAAGVAVIQAALNKLGATLKVDGISGPVTKAAIAAFQESHGLKADGVAGPLTRAEMSRQLDLLEKLPVDAPPIVIEPTEPEPPLPELPPVEDALPAERTLLTRVIEGMEKLGYKIDKGVGEINIAYAEGHNRQSEGGGRNENKPGLWNDVRMAFTYEGDQPRLLGEWTATTQPGPYYTIKPLNAAGAANIFPGQYKAWKVALHRGQYEALCQRGTLKLTRDKNKDYKREGDAVEVGDYEGINHHHGANASEIGPHSAGCLVGKMQDGHESFMFACKSDPRFKANRDFMFTAAILLQSEVPL